MRKLILFVSLATFHVNLIAQNAAYYAAIAESHQGTPASSNPRVLLNFTHGATQGGYWNDLSADPTTTGSKYTDFNDSTGAHSGIGLDIVAAASYIDNLPGYTSGSGIYPDAVINNAWGVQGGSWEFTLNGLVAGGDYKITFFARAYNYGGDGLNDTQYLSFNGGANQPMTGLINNLTTTTTYTVTSDGTGKITVQVIPVDGAGTRRALLCSLIIQEQ